MSEEKKVKLGKKQIIIITTAVAVVIVASVLIWLFSADGPIRATTMRLLRMEGTVTLEENGENKTVKENLRFKSGDAVSTDVQSLVSVGLDDTKIVTLDEESRAEFQKAGKDLELTLTKGKLFFNVTEKLDADASFSIRTSDMVVGIRGTSGVYTVDEYGRPALYLTDGVVEITATNPETNETKTITVTAGTRVSVYFYSNAEEGHTVEFYEVKMTPNMIPGFAMDQICSSEELMQRIATDTGWKDTEIKDIGDKVKAGTYTPIESEPVNLGLMEPDDLMPKTKLEEVVEEPEEEEPTEEAEEEPAEEPAEEPEVEAVNEPQVAAPVDYAALGRSDPAVLAAISEIGEDGTIYLQGGVIFDWEYYAKMNPLVALAYGNDPYALLYHYIHYGQSEDSRFPSAEEEHQVAAEKVEEQRKAEQFQKEQEEANRRAAEEENTEANNQSSSSTPTSSAYSTISGMALGSETNIGNAFISRDQSGNYTVEGNDYAITTTGFTQGNGYVTFDGLDGGTYRLDDDGTITQIQ
jgi:hypothetical protein